MNVLIIKILNVLCNMTNKKMVTDGYMVGYNFMLTKIMLYLLSIKALYNMYIIICNYVTIIYIYYYIYYK